MEGTALIASERLRQVSIEGWTPEHDAKHSGGELLRAATSYLDAAYGQVVGRSVKVSPPMGWPFDQSWWKPSDSVRNLAKAGALIAAEIDRIQRLPRCIYRVQLEPGVWLATGAGDPPRTLQHENAATFCARVEAEAAIAEARCYRPFHVAIIESSIVGG